MSDEVQKVKDRTNIVDVVGAYVQLRRAGRNYTGRCPFHKERTPSFYVSPERGTYKCFGCGEGGDIFSFIEKIDGVDFKTALQQLAEKAGVVLEHRGAPRPPEEKQKEERLREVCEAATAYFELELKRHKDAQAYLHTRGLTDETSAAWRLGYAPATWDSASLYLQKVGFSQEDILDAGFAVRSERRVGQIFDRFRGRIIFPLFDLGGRPIAVSGRFFEEVKGGALSPGRQAAKYVNSPETLIFKKSRTLYGLDKARGYIRKADCILLVEGQFDLLMSHQAGLPFAVALSGTALTPEHLSLLGRLSKRLVLALDADQAGVRAGLRSTLLAIAAGFEVKVPTFTAGQDPADIAKENPELLKAAVRTSHTAIEFFLDALRPGVRDERGYAALVQQQILPLVAAYESRVDQEHFAQVVARRLGVSQEAVLAEVAKKPRLLPETSSESHSKEAELTVSPLERKVGMLLFGWAPGKERLEELFGREHLSQFLARLEPRAEDFRFEFDKEVGEHTTEEVVAEDMLAELRKTLERERFKMRFV